MADGLGWSAAQWERVNSEVTEAFEKANVVGKFLPKYGPLPDSAEYVKDERLAYARDVNVDQGSPGAQLSVTDDTTVKLFNLTVHVVLSREQVSEESLSSASLAFRRAANMLAQAEDRLVFQGHTGPSGKSADEKFKDAQRNREAAEKARENAAKKLQAAIKDNKRDEAGAAVIAKAKAEEELLAAAREEQDALEQRQREFVNTSADNAARDGLVEAAPRFDYVTPIRAANAQEAGEKLVSAVAEATTKLENRFHPGPFACVLGTLLYTAAHTPGKDAMVLPADRITPLLNGTSGTTAPRGIDRLLFQCGQLDRATGVVVSLAGGDIDLVVATPPRVEFLQIDVRAKYVFRVYEKFIWRIKDPKAILLLNWQNAPK